MRKYTVFALSAFLALALCACSGKNENMVSSGTQSPSSAVTENHNSASSDVSSEMNQDASSDTSSQPGNDTSSQTADTSSNAENVTKLTKDDAIAVALDHAGLTEAEVTRLEAEYDMDDGVAEYDVEFDHSGYEYDYEIDAQTGAVISYHKEKAD